MQDIDFGVLRSADFGNPRQIDDASLDALKASLIEFGDLSSFVLDKTCGLICGHQRLRALQQQHGNALALRRGEDGVLRIYTPTGGSFRVREVDWPRATCIAANVAANSPLLAGEFTPRLGGLLEEVIRELPDLSEALRLGELEVPVPELGPVEGLMDPDAVPEPPEEPITQRGDLWLLGEHRLLCGDATKAEDVERVTECEKMAVCLTDPPYGIGLDYGVFKDSEDDGKELATRWLPIAREVAECVVFSCGVTRQWWYPEPNWVLCWFYGGGQHCSAWGFSCWQPFLCYGPDPSLARGMGRRPDAVDLNVPANASDLGHPCPKPMALWSWLLERITFRLEELVFDPFVGSGTTIIACEQLGRRCRAMEIEPRYCDVAVRRWEEFTGKKAVRVTSDKPTGVQDGEAPCAAVCTATNK